jgi:hypothetical protein
MPILESTKTGEQRHAIHSRSALGPFAQLIFDRHCQSGTVTMTGAIAFLMCVSVAVLFAHAFNAYRES